ncbi:MAG TPA: hypothetical protein VFO96_06820 [Gemmatimonadales bacterium]|jgi:hypothetical protein|nr:hypothetical protein [Gemmatimonadales bacterium]
MRKTLTGWLVLTLCFVLLGVGTAIGARISRRDALDQATITKWRHYAAEVEQGKRTASPMQVTALTELAISQNAYAASAMQLLELLGGGVAVLGLVLGGGCVEEREARDKRRGTRDRRRALNAKRQAHCH